MSETSQMERPHETPHVAESVRRFTVVRRLEAVLIGSHEYHGEHFRKRLFACEIRNILL